MNLPTEDELARHLNINGADPATMDEVLGTFAKAVAVVEEQVGPLTPRAVTETVYHRGGSTLILRKPPVVSVTGVQTTAVPPQVFAGAGFVLDGEAGMLTWTGEPGLGPGWLQVSYVSGRAAGQIPADLHGAVLDRTLIEWMSQRRGSVSRSSMGEAQGATLTPTIRRYEDAIRPHLLTDLMPLP